MALDAAVQNVDHEVWHTPQNSNAFIEYTIVVKIETQRSAQNCADVVKGMELIPLGKLFPREIVVEPTRHPNGGRDREGPQRIIGVVNVEPEGR